MKKCNECGCNPANVQVTQIMQNETRVIHLCEECARKKGIAIMLDTELLSTQEMIENGSQKACSFCGLSLEQYRGNGLLGCPDCYKTFQDDIDEMLFQLHGSSMHRGKKYIGLSEEVCRQTNMEQLSVELASAIKNEEFEQAAAIRDAIHSLKKMGKE